MSKDCVEKAIQCPENAVDQCCEIRRGDGDDNSTNELVIKAGKNSNKSSSDGRTGGGIVKPPPKVKLCKFGRKMR